jgi:hypothetical protein
MKSLAIKTAAVTIAVVLSGIALRAAFRYQVQASSEAATADIDAIIERECARKKRSGQISSRCLKYYQ